jgi:hypothetical protein
MAQPKAGLHLKYHTAWMANGGRVALDSGQFGVAFFLFFLLTTILQAVSLARQEQKGMEGQSCC